MAILIGALYFAFSALVAAGMGMLLALFCHPARVGPTARVVHLMYTAMLVGVGGEMWAGAFGFKADMRGRPWEELYGMAIGYSIGASWLWMRRQRGYQRFLRIRAERAHRWPVTLFFDYMVGVIFCLGALVGGTEVTPELRARVARWIASSAHLSGQRGLIGAHIVLAMAGLVWSQVITASVQRAMRAALTHDRQITRRWKYILFAVPFAMCLPVSVVAPGILAGILINLATLWVGWRYTAAPPSAFFGTLKILLAEDPPRWSGLRRLKAVLLRIRPLAFTPPAVKPADSAAAGEPQVLTGPGGPACGDGQRRDTFQDDSDAAGNAGTSAR